MNRELFTVCWALMVMAAAIWLCCRLSRLCVKLDQERRRERLMRAAIESVALALLNERDRLQLEVDELRKLSTAKPASESVTETLEPPDPADWWKGKS